MDRQLRIVLVGEESAGLRVLRHLESTGHAIVAVLAQPARLEQESVAALAERLSLPLRPPTLVTNAGFAETLRRERVDLLLNVHSLHVAAAEVVAAPSLGSFNLHPGPLPAYAGLDAPSWAVYNEESRHGCTLHWMTAEVDEGPIAYATAFDVDPDETAISLYLKCVRHGVPLVAQLVEAAERGGRDAIPALTQDPSERRYFTRIPPHEGRLLWALEAHRLEALVRACDYGPFNSPWGRPKTWVGGVEIEILRATTAAPTAAEAGTIGMDAEGGVLVAAADRWLRIEAIQVAGLRVEPASALHQGDRCTPVRE